MVKKTIILFYIFCSFTLLVSGEKNILPNLTNSQEPELVFWPLGAGATWKKIPGAGAALEKFRSRSRLKKSQEPEPEPEPLKH